MADAATETGLVRLVARCSEPGEVPTADAIAVGTETPWLSRAAIERWRQEGSVVIGLFPIGDRPAVELLCRSEVDQLFTQAVEPLVVLRAIRDLTEDRRLARSVGPHDQGEDHS